jgi:pimeloyl-ACP methyl ester carboxylesterase
MWRGDGRCLSAIDFGGSGRTSLLVHGAGLNALCFAPLARALATELRCVGLDLSGHGCSDAPPRVDWSVFADDVGAAVQELGAEMIGVGHSLGASALFTAEAARPGSFAALFCYEPIVIDDALPNRPQSGADARLARRRTPRFASRDEAGERFSAKSPFATFDPDALAGYLEEGLVDDEGSVLLACRPETEAAIYESAPEFDVLGLLDRVNCPVTVAFGESSDVMKGADAEVVASRLSHGRTAPIPGLDHFGPFNAPALVAEVLLQGLRTAEA